MSETLKLEPLDKNSMTQVTTWLNKKWLDRPVKRMRAVFELYEWLEGIDEAEARAYIVLDGQRQIGAVLFEKISWTNRHAWLNIIYEGKDLVDIVDVAMDKASDLNLRKVSTEVLADATDSIASFEEAGFKVEVRKRQSLFRRGNYKTILEMAAFTGNDERTRD